MNTTYRDRKVIAPNKINNQFFISEFMQKVKKQKTYKRANNLCLLLIIMVGILWLPFQALAQERTFNSYPIGEEVVFPPADRISTNAEISGELRQWHKVTLTIDGPRASSYGTTMFLFDEDSGELHLDVRPQAGPPGRLSYMHPNPFLDYRMTVTFKHESGNLSYEVPGYFAADGNAAQTGVMSGNKWRAHLSPDKIGRWDWEVSFVAGVNVSVDNEAPSRLYKPYDGLKGSFVIEETNKQYPDFRARGRLQYVGKHYPQFAGTGEYFLKVGTDSPETLLAYADFDGTYTMMVPGEKGWVGPADGHGLKEYAPHIQDWREGDPTWRNGKGRGLIGAINYLSSKGMNAMSFIPRTAGGDGENVWPWVSRNDKLHYHIAKLDQWEIVFAHAQQMGIFLHFKMQEQENDSSFPHRARLRPNSLIPEALDGGLVGIERKLMTREFIARFGHHLALNWNMGEEIAMKNENIAKWSEYFKKMDPYNHLIVSHSLGDLPGQSGVYPELLGDQSELTGASLQTRGYGVIHKQVLHWLEKSSEANKPWTVSYDEQGLGRYGIPPDPGYMNWEENLEIAVTIDEIRKTELWGTLMAGGYGMEHYFGYIYPHNDLNAQDWRSRDMYWDQARYAVEFFKNNNVPFWEMKNHNSLIGNLEDDNSKYCFAKPGETYVVYLPDGGTTDLDLGEARGRFQVSWYNPRTGGILQEGTVSRVSGGRVVSLGTAPVDLEQDWVILITK